MFEFMKITISQVQDLVQKREKKEKTENRHAHHHTRANLRRSGNGKPLQQNVKAAATRTEKGSENENENEKGIPSGIEVTDVRNVSRTTETETEIVNETAYENVNANVIGSVIEEVTVIGIERGITETTVSVNVVTATRAMIGSARMERTRVKRNEIPKNVFCVIACLSMSWNLALFYY